MLLAKVDVKPDFLTLYRYWSFYGDDAGVMKHLYAAAGGALVPFGFVGWLVLSRNEGPALYGEARFAKRREIEAAGLLGTGGIVIGKMGNRYLIYSGDSHVYVAAPTRGGKGVGIVIPNLLNWSESVVVLDIKQENWDLTSGFRAAHGNACFLFNPAARDGRAHRWNALAYISEELGARINDIQKIASMIWPDPADGGDPIWTASCRSLFLGLVLYLLKTPGATVTLGEVLRQGMSATPRRLKETLEKLQGSEEPLSPACIAALSDYLDTSDNTRTSIRNSFTSRLELWQNPMIDAATSANDFDLRELRRRRMSVYIGITPDDLDRLSPIINLLFQQIIDLNTRELPQQDPSLKFKCLLLMDEFMAPGRIPVLAKGISYIAGYGLRILAIFQSPGQVRDPRGGYGHEAAETLFDNMDVRVVFAPANFRIAKEISDELGTDTVKKRSKGKSGIAFKSKSHSENESEHGRALLLPQEVKEIGQWSEILLVRNVKPIRCEKIRYFLDPVFTDRLRAVSPVLQGGTKEGRPPAKDILDKAMSSGSLAAPVPVLEVDPVAGLREGPRRPWRSRRASRPGPSRQRTWKSSISSAWTISASIFRTWQFPTARFLTSRSATLPRAFTTQRREPLEEWPWQLKEALRGWGGVWRRRRWFGRPTCDAATISIGTARRTSWNRRRGSNSSSGGQDSLARWMPPPRQRGPAPTPGRRCAPARPRDRRAGQGEVPVRGSGSCRSGAVGRYYQQPTEAHDAALRQFREERPLTLQDLVDLREMQRLDIAEALEKHAGDRKAFERNAQEIKDRHGNVELPKELQADWERLKDFERQVMDSRTALQFAEEDQRMAQWSPEEQQQHQMSTTSTPEEAQANLETARAELGTVEREFDDWLELKGVELPSQEAVREAAAEEERATADYDGADERAAALEVQQEHDREEAWAVDEAEDLEQEAANADYDGAAERAAAIELQQQHDSDDRWAVDDVGDVERDAAIER